jgi:transposase-like protein
VSIPTGAQIYAQIAGEGISIAEYARRIGTSPTNVQRRISMYRDATGAPPIGKPSIAKRKVPAERSLLPHEWTTYEPSRCTRCQMLQSWPGARESCGRRYRSVK